MRILATMIIAATAFTAAELPARTADRDVFPSAVREQAKLASSLSCFDLIDLGWSKNPDVSEYVLSKPHAEKLGYGSPCAIDSLVFSQCWLEPRLSVKQAIDMLLAKAVAGRKLPDTPMCGA
jgi:hypothetical protein